MAITGALRTSEKRTEMKKVCFAILYGKLPRISESGEVTKSTAMNRENDISKMRDHAHKYAISLGEASPFFLHPRGHRNK